MTQARDAFVVARCKDVSRAAELLAFTRAVFAELDIDPPSSVLKETEGDFAARLADDICFIIEDNGRPIGSVFCECEGADALYIGRLAVAPEWRRRGVAGALVDAAKAEARRMGLARVTLGARIALPDNVSLFKRHGFVVTAEKAHAGFAHPTSYDMEWRAG
jgi:ribosomal protein S18 acetylase RimI-like enzyme